MCCTPLNAPARWQFKKYLSAIYLFQLQGGITKKYLNAIYLFQLGHLLPDFSFSLAQVSLLRFYVERSTFSREVIVLAQEE